MRKLLVLISFILFTPYANAEATTTDGIPSAIMDQIYKKHPNALDFSAEKKVHFSQNLLKIYYKDGEEKHIDYYRQDGHFYVAGSIVAADDMMFSDSKEKLKSAFNEYKIKEAIMVVNPNGNGEEFDVVLENAGKNWNVVIDKKGNIEKTELN